MRGRRRARLSASGPYWRCSPVIRTSAAGLNRGCSRVASSVSRGGCSLEAETQVRQHSHAHQAANHGGQGANVGAVAARDLSRHGGRQGGGARLTELGARAQDLGLGAEAEAEACLPHTQLSRPALLPHPAADAINRRQPASTAGARPPCCGRHQPGSQPTSRRPPPVSHLSGLDVELGEAALGRVALRAAVVAGLVLKRHLLAVDLNEQAWRLVGCGGGGGGAEGRVGRHFRSGVGP